MGRLYPELKIDLEKIRHNTRETVKRCEERGIDVCAVIKGCSGLVKIAEAVSRSGVKQLATSRIQQAVKCREAGITTPFLLLRVPALSEIPDVIQYFNYSLQSELLTVQEMEKACAAAGVTHKVIMMMDLGDIREGYWDKEAFVRDCVYIHNRLEHIRLAGIGTNLGCYGAVKPTEAKMAELVSLAEEIREQTGTPLEIISGGASNAFPLVQDGTMPEGINHLRIGDNILLSRGLQTKLKVPDTGYLDMTAFVVRAEIVEVREKPSYPQGELSLNAYGKLPQFEDRGIRKRALAALGDADAGDVTELLPVDEKIWIVGGSSDYIILDVTETETDLHIGDVVEFYPEYVNMLHLTMSPDVRITWVNE